MSDEKYIVLKREEWDDWWARVEDRVPSMPPHAVEDAVVIRRQDTFAPPALDAYANSIQTVIEALKAAGMEDAVNVKGLRDIADYFHTQAHMSWNQIRKLPD